jgi:amidase/aspartyl-tRNA(Asn)/glutamyl-tRNA(Gln) amidotransferase subunit A
VELLDGVIQEIERRNPSINGMIIFGFDDAREQAKRAEQAVMSGEKLGPLHGGLTGALPLVKGSTGRRSATAWNSPTQPGALGNGPKN